MPQLDTTWSITIMSMILSLFILFQLKISKHHYPHNTETSMKLHHKTLTPWEKKWMKTYLPLLLLPIVTIIIMFPMILFPTSKRLINNHVMSIQQWLLKQTSKQMMSIHNYKGQTWTLMLVTLIIFIVSTNLLGLLPHSFTPTTQLSMNLSIAVPLWAATMITGFWHKTKTSLAHFLPQGTPTLLIPMLVIIETISPLIQPLALAVRLTANITASHLLMHLIGSATLALMSINLTVATTTFIVLVLPTILEFAVALSQAYEFTLLVSLYLHENT